jgi:hypothetical protein
MLDYESFFMHINIFLSNFNTFVDHHICVAPFTITFVSNNNNNNNLSSLGLRSNVTSNNNAQKIIFTFFLLLVNSVVFFSCPKCSIKDRLCFVCCCMCEWVSEWEREREKEYRDNRRWFRINDQRRKHSILRVVWQ